MSLTKDQRDALPASDFAVPEKRALPMHDETHVKMAWDMVDRTKGLTPEEKKTARERILRRAHELGINTDNWNKLKAMRFEAMAIELPEVKDHPNRVPFSGVLTRIDEPSDNPLGGSHGKRVIIPKAVAEKALPSLLGMAVDFTPELDGHDPQSKIGIITEANIIGNAIHIAGFFYGADFPTEVKTIQANKASLGFSYEAQARVRSLDDDPLVVESCDFTGAAVLYKNKAAYTTTSLNAKAEKDMSKELLDKISALEAQIAELKAAGEKQKLEAASVHDMVKPHAERVRAAADAMEAAGIGMHAARGHVAHLRSIANHMEAEAVMGRVPQIYYTNDYMSAGADNKKQEAANDEKSKEFDSLKASIDELKTKLADAEKSRFDASAQPERKTLPPQALAILAKNGIQPGNGKITVEQADEFIEKGKLSRVAGMAFKQNLHAAGMLETKGA